MANIQRRIGKDGKVTWRVRVRVANARVQTASFRRKTDATKWAGKVENALRDGQHLPDRQERQRTLAVAIARYREVILPQYSAVERKKRDAKLGWWERQLGSRNLRELSTGDISLALERLAAGGLSAERAGRTGGSFRLPGPATQRDYLGTIRHVLSVAREWEWVADNPTARVRKPREPRGRLRFLSAEERDRLLAACRASDNPLLYPWVALALGTGAREGELLNLRWADIDLGRGRAIAQETKNDDRRALVLTGQALEVLRDLSRVRRIDTDLVFAGRAGTALFPRKAWNRALREAELADFRFHDLRHTFASYLAMSGATLAELAEALGHKTLAMVKRYAHLSEQHTSGVVERMTEQFLS